MLDQTRPSAQSRPAFDITRTSLTEAEEPILHPVPRRDRADKTDAIRRLLDSENIPHAGTGPLDDQEMDRKSRPADAPEAGRLGLLVAREQTHGSFADNARVSQSIKRIFRDEPGWGLLTDVEREAMDMIALKFSRILSGKSLELQHWEDVVGYAKLAEEQCQPAT